MSYRRSVLYAPRVAKSNDKYYRYCSFYNYYILKYDNQITFINMELRFKLYVQFFLNYKYFFFIKRMMGPFFFQGRVYTGGGAYAIAPLVVAPQAVAPFIPAAHSVSAGITGKTLRSCTKMESEFIWGTGCDSG